MSGIGRTSKWSGLAEVEAECQDCSWGSMARNALPNAKRHAEVHGHRVRCLQQISVTYAPLDMGRDEVFGPPTGKGGALHG